MFKRFIFAALISGIVIVLAAYFINRRQESTETFKTAQGIYSKILGSTIPVHDSSSRALATTGAENESSVASPEDLHKIQTLREILKSKNDNDPRLDTDFKSLSENAKHLMRQEYKTLHAERFNEKGTIVFLLGRNMTTPRDFQFLADVLSEPPCFNIEDCSKPAPKYNPQFADEETLNGVTTAYPQIVSVKNLQAYLARNDIPPALKNLAVGDLNLATTSRNPRISQMAQNALTHLNQPDTGF